MSRRGENIYKRKDGRWEGRYKKGRKIDGTLKYGYIYGKSYQEVRTKLYSRKVYQETLVELSGEGAASFAEWTAHWLQENQLLIKPSTYATYAYKLEKYVLPTLGQVLLNELTQEHLNQLTKELQNKNLKISTIHVIIRLVRTVLAAAVKQKIIFENPCDLVSLPKRTKQKISALSIKEQKKVEKGAAALKNGQGLPTLISLHTGMRIGELAALRWSDIDFERNVIRVHKTYQRIMLPTAAGKTQLCFSSVKSDASVRLIPLSKKVKGWLKEHAGQHRNPTEFVFSNSMKPCEPRLLTYHFQKLMQKIGMPHIHFHQLRHTFATRCLEAKADIVSVSELLGHSSTQMTLDIYADALLEQRIRVIQTMEKSLI